ncbi:hypothetical protein MRX96_042159 [Rhipicephalus microplus]
MYDVSLAFVPRSAAVLAVSQATEPCGARYSFDVRASFGRADVPFSACTATRCAAEASTADCLDLHSRDGEGHSPITHFASVFTSCHAVEISREMSYNVQLYTL